MNSCVNNSEFEMSNKEGKAKKLFVKSRQDQWENEVYMNKAQTVAERIQYNKCGDRFIPRRFMRTDMELNFNFAKNHEIKDIMTASLKENYWRRNNFIAAINNVFGIEKRPLLDFSKSTNVHKATPKPAPRLRTDLDWPCRPRSKPFAYSDATHDLPDFDVSFDRNLIDWSAKDQLAVSFGEAVIIWKSRDDVTMVFHLKRPSSLAYSPNGEYLAFGCVECDYPDLELWKVNTSHDFLVMGVRCFGQSNLAVTCIEWSKNGKEIVCGTKKGNMFVLAVPDLSISSVLTNQSKLSVAILRFSPTMRYLASADVKGYVTIYHWKTQQIHANVCSKHGLTVSLDWHPWNGVDLAISEKAPASITILHVPTKEVVAAYSRKDRSMVIYSINFSKITGELLVSVSRIVEHDECQWVVLVMSSLMRIVDILNIPEAGARFMMWSPDGTKLSTASLDETLTIWNFYPEQKKKNNRQCSKSSIFGNELSKWMRMR